MAGKAATSAGSERMPTCRATVLNHCRWRKAFATTRTAYGEEAIEIDVPSPNPALQQVVLYTDEAGVMTWHFVGGASSEGEVRCVGRRTYRLARRVAPATEAATTRNLAFGLPRRSSVCGPALAVTHPWNQQHDR